MYLTKIKTQKIHNQNDKKKYNKYLRQIKINIMKENYYDLELSKKVYDHYIENEIGYNKTCTNCKNHALKYGRNLVNGPIPLFHLGANYEKSSIRILFLGIVAYGWNDKIRDTFFIGDKELRKNNLFETIDTIEKRVEELRDFSIFKFTKKCSDKIFDNNGIRNIAISNLLKCNTGETNNKNLQKTFDYCVNKEYTGNLHYDLDLLKPTHVVILSYNQRFWKYEKQIKNRGIKTMKVPHPSSRNIKGSLDYWADEVNSFVKG